MLFGAQLIYSQRFVHLRFDGEDEEPSLISDSDLKLVKEQEEDTIKKNKNKDESIMSNDGESELSMKSAEFEFTKEGFYKRLEQEIQENSLLIDRQAKTNFFNRIFSKYTKKSGVDLYPQIALIQVLLLIYIFIFFNFMNVSAVAELEQNINFNQFSGSMVVMMMIQITFMVWERYIALYTSEKVRDKEIEKIELAVKARKQGLTLSDNMKHVNQVQQEIEALERLYKEEEKSQSARINGINGDHLDKSGEKEVEDKKESEAKEKNMKTRVSQVLMKYIQLTMISILFTYFTFFYIPQPFFIQPMDNSINWNHYSTNGFLGGFYFFFCIYFTLSALQIKLGYNPFKVRNTILIKKNLVSGVIAKTFRAIPFLQELKVVMDWTFTATTLDLFQWFKIEEIHFLLYCAKVDSNAHNMRQVGLKQPRIMKFFMGWLLLFAILMLIFGPMILFSGLNPTSKLNNITNASFSMGIQLNGQSGNYFELYVNSNIGNLQTVPSSQMGPFSNIPLIINSDPQQFQVLAFAIYIFKIQILFIFEKQFSLFSASDANWQLSIPSINYIIAFLEGYTEQSSDIIQFKTQYSFLRNVTSLNSAPTTFLYPVSLSNLYEKTTTLSLIQVKELLQIMKTCNSRPMFIYDFYISLLRLDTIEDTFKARPFTSLTQQEQMPFFKSVYLRLECSPKDQNIRYWTLSLDAGGQKGLTFQVLCDKYSSILMGLSIITIYTSVILVIGRLIKSVFSGDCHLIMFTEQPQSDRLIKICDAIAYSRTERDLVKENLLYWELIDLLRSPEVIKMLTGSYSKTILNKRKRELEEAERAAEEKANKRKVKKD